MKTIYKYPVQILDKQEIQLPKNAEILSIQNQREEACLWARVETSAPMETRHLCVFGTGHPAAPEWGELEFISTVQFAEGSLVFHFFENVPIQY